MKNKAQIFWIFGILQSLVLGLIIFLIFNSFYKVAGFRVIGLDTQIILSTLFPVFLLFVEYNIYASKVKDKISK